MKRTREKAKVKSERRKVSFFGRNSPPEIVHGGSEVLKSRVRSTAQLAFI